jgi:serine/threonine protein kinase
LRIYVVVRHGRDEKLANYIVMEYWPLNLYEHIRSREYRSKNNRHKFKIALDIAKGLTFLHQNKIIHCDMHSGNVLHNPAGEKVSRFCLSVFTV